jgi:uncharacterized protein YqhQ
MMRGSSHVAAAMRLPDGTITIYSEPLSGIYTGNIKKYPFVRGVIALWDALGLGMRFLTISANNQTGEDEKIEGTPLVLTMIISMSIAVILFFVTPAAIGHWLQTIINLQPWISNLYEGLIRLILIIGYMWGVGKIPEIARVFAYHGAEHKTINAFEAGADLTPEQVQTFSLVHPRCGTSFLLTLVVLSIIIFTLIGPLSMAWRLVSRILLIPVLAGISYEYIRWTAGHIENPIVNIIMYPNLLLQKLTTREPDHNMLEVAIASLNKILDSEKTM